MAIDKKFRSRFDAPKLALVAVLTILVASGVLYLNHLQGDSPPASEADCTLAQQMFNETATIPADDATAQKWEAKARQIATSRLTDDGLRTELLAYVRWARVKMTGVGDKPPADEVDAIIDRATGRCDGSGVDLTIREIAF